ncbi:MAG: molybdate ABC transporter substrate-binding protein [Marmoricola sp.]
MNSITRSKAVIAVVAALGLLPTLVGCGGGSGSADNATLTVFAAASLTEPFTDLGKEFEAAHPGVHVQFSFGASSDLATQVEQGAPADVLATASTTTMRQAGDQAEDVRDFATNSMEIAVPAANPGHVHRLGDLARPGVKVALCQAKVPCGVVAAEVLKSARLHVRPATEEVDVKSVLTKVALGEVDAGIVYVSDVHTGPETVRGVPIPTRLNAVTTYPITVLGGTAHQKLADAFVALVTGPDGRSALRDAGFAGPPP